MIGRVNTGGGTGGTLMVTAPAGVTVTVSKDGKTKTKTAGADGLAVFKGLKSGQWTLTITDGEQTAQKTVTITADYFTAIAFFSATIHVTYPAGSTCTATDGVTTLTAPDTSGSWDCVLPNAGVWIFSCSDGENSVSESVEITENGQSENLQLKFYLYLYHRGDQCLETVGSWVAVKGPSGAVTWNTDSVYLGYTGPTGRYASIYTGSVVDVTKYNTLRVLLSDLETEEQTRIGLVNSPYTGNNASGASFVAEQILKTSNAEEQLVSVDISSLSGNYYFQFVAGISKVNVHEVYLA